MAAPLDGVTVVALEQAVAAPFATRQLADLGARARAHVVRARAEIPAHGRVALAPALAMLGVYEGYLEKMEAADHARPGPEMSRGEKLRRGLAAVLRA